MNLADKIRRLLAVAIGVPVPMAPIPCRVCGRSLTSPKSIEAGVGACCAKKRARDERTIDLFEAGTPGSELQ